jgi:hypothetical protein
VTECPWEPIESFTTPGEFARFVAWMSKLISERAAEEVPVRRPYSGAASLTEKWYKHRDSDQVWRLVWPDGAFTGVFKRVS